VIAPSYIHFEFSTRKLPEPVIRLYPLACLHIGAPQADVKFVKEHLKRIAEDPCARWIYMGDGGECVTKYSKGDIYGQLMPPQLQIEMLLDLLRPIKDKGLFGVRGNHGHRVYKETGLSFDHTLLTALGMPYMGVATMAHFIVNRSHYDTYWHHGTDSGISLRSKIQAAEQFANHKFVDALFTAHSHVALELHPRSVQFCDNSARKVGTKLMRQYICGSAYDSRTGYAEDKGYPALMPSFIRVAFDGRIHSGRALRTQKPDTYYSDGQHAIEHDYLQTYLDRAGHE
jgi:hypothetical protein